MMNQHHVMFLTQVVLDVGSGVGILSLLAAKAGAKMVSQKHRNAGIHCLPLTQVYALELPGMADLAEQVAHLNTSRIQVLLPLTHVTVNLSRHFVLFEGCSR